MTSFEPGILDAQPLSQNLLPTVRLIGEYKGKQALFRQRSPQVLETLQQVAIIQSAESSNRLEGIVTAYDTLYWPSQGWHEGQHNLTPWWEYFLGLILKAYRDFEQRVGQVAQTPGRKRQQVLAAVARLPQQFQIADLERACPGGEPPHPEPSASSA